MIDNQYLITKAHKNFAKCFAIGDFVAPYSCSNVLSPIIRHPNKFIFHYIH